MFNLYYPNAQGDRDLIGSFSSYNDCMTQITADNQDCYTIEQVVSGQVVWVQTH